MDIFDLVPIVSVVSIVVIAVTAILAKYKLKVEQIKADAMVRAEEVRCRNQLELEKILREGHNATADLRAGTNEPEHLDEEYGRRKSRIHE